jgi:DNA-directed RNA polymerase specialized sigma24 family protein
VAKRHKETRQYKTTQAYFRGVLSAERQIQFLEAEIEKQQSRLFLSGVDGGEVVSKTTEGDSLERGMSELYDYVDKLDTELIGYVEEREEAMKVLSNIAHTPAYEVVRYRYFEGYRYKDIARLMVYTEDYIYELHRTAMNDLYRFLPREHNQRRGKND